MTAKHLVRYGSLGYLVVILVAPVALIFYRAFEHGFGTFWSSITTPFAIDALWLTV